jgi:hypothetical protein
MPLNVLAKTGIRIEINFEKFFVKILSKIYIHSLEKSYQKCESLVFAKKRFCKNAKVK